VEILMNSFLLGGVIILGTILELSILLVHRCFNMGPSFFFPFFIFIFIFLLQFFRFRTMNRDCRLIVTKHGKCRFW